MTSTVDRLVIDDLAAELVEAEAEIVRCRHEIDIRRDMISELLEQVATLSKRCDSITKRLRIAMGVDEERAEDDVV